MSWRPLLIALALAARALPGITEDASEAQQKVERSDPRALVPTTVDRIGRVWVRVFINDKGPFRMALDTGSDSTAVLERVSEQLKIPVREDEKVLLYGTTGASFVRSIKVDSLKIGTFEIRDVRVPIVNDAFDGADGILGTRGWHDARIFLDFINDVFHISPSQGQKAPPGFTRIPMRLTKNLLIALEVNIGGIKTKAILDSGSQQTIGNVQLLNALSRSGIVGKEQEIIGITGDVTKGRSRAVPPIVIEGRVQVNNLSVIFGDVFIFDIWKLNDEPAIIIGMDAIASFGGLIIDYRKGELYLKARGRHGSR